MSFGSGFEMIWNNENHYAQDTVGLTIIFSVLDSIPTGCVVTAQSQKLWSIYSQLAPNFLRHANVQNKPSLPWVLTLTQQSSSNTHMLRNLSNPSSKTQENAYRRLLTMTWHYKTLLSKSAITLTNNNNNNLFDTLSKALHYCTRTVSGTVFPVIRYLLRIKYGAFCERCSEF